MIDHEENDHELIAEIMAMPSPQLKVRPVASPLDTPPEHSERGLAAKNYLDANGITSIRPPVRSTDYLRGHEDPFYYYLTYRLGIHLNTPRKVTAFETGSLFHLWMQVIRTPPNMRAEPNEPHAALVLRADAAVQAEADRILEEVSKSASDKGILPGGVPLEDFRAELAKEASLAASMGRLCEELLPLRSRSYPQMEVLHIERLLAADLPRQVGGHFAVGRIDTIVADHQRLECWIEDHKSTSFEPNVRAALATFEFPVRLYRLLVDANKESLKLPYKVVGFRHNIIQKPGIRRKQKETQEDFIERFRQWLTSTGEYSHLEAERRAKQEFPYLTSMVRFGEPLYPHEFVVQLQEATSLATRMAFPDNFPRFSITGKFGNKPHDLAPFYLHPPKFWPDIIARGDYVHGQHRDWEEAQEVN